MGYTKVKLKGTKAELINDIKRLTFNDELVYPNYPADYQKSFGNLNRFIVTTPSQEVITPGTYNEAGEETTPPVLGDFISKLVLPEGYDTASLVTKVS